MGPDTVGPSLRLKYEGSHLCGPTVNFPSYPTSQHTMKTLPVLHPNDPRQREGFQKYSKEKRKPCDFKRAHVRAPLVPYPAAKTRMGGLTPSAPLHLAAGTRRTRRPVHPSANTPACFGGGGAGTMETPLPVEGGSGDLPGVLPEVLTH